MSNNGDFLAGLVIGGLLGFVAGVLTAPSSGRETREVIVDRTQNVVDQARENVGTVGAKVKDNVGRAVEVAKEKLPGSCCDEGTTDKPELV